MQIPNHIQLILFIFSTRTVAKGIENSIDSHSQEGAAWSPWPADEVRPSPPWVDRVTLQQLVTDVISGSIWRGFGYRAGTRYLLDVIRPRSGAESGPTMRAARLMVGRGAKVTLAARRRVQKRSTGRGMALCTRAM
jgi:hypothetical protein